MQPPPNPESEPERIEALRHYQLLDTQPEQALDDLTTLAASICEAPMALISLVDEHRQWFKSKLGLETLETPRDISFCGHAILQRELLIVPDAAKDDRFADNPMVTGAPHVRFYAGVPLATPAGHAIGTLCVLDHVPRVLKPSQLEALRVLGRQAMSQLELRRQSFDLLQSQERLRMVTENARVGLVIVNQERRYIYANTTYSEILGLSSANLVGQRVSDVLSGVYEQQIRSRLDRAFCGERVLYDLRKPSASGECFYSVRYEPARGAGADQLVVVVITDITEHRKAEQAQVDTERLFAALFEASPVGIAIYRTVGELIRCNRSYYQILRRTEEELRAGDYTHPEDRVRGAELFAAMSAGRHEAYSRDKRYLAPDGSVIWTHLVATAIRDRTGGSDSFFIMLEDITERKHAELRVQYLNRVYAVLSEINQTITRVRDRQQLFDAACRVAVEKGRFRMAWIGLADPTQNSARLVAHAGASPEVLRLLLPLLGDETTPCQCVFTSDALRTGSHSVCNDIEGDPRSLQWRRDALAQGYRAMASLPLRADGRVIGAFNLYTGETGFFDAEELQLLDELAQNIGFALEVGRREAERTQMDEALRWRTAFFEAQVDSSPDAVLVVDSANRVLLRNDRLRKLFNIPFEIDQAADDVRLLSFVTNQMQDSAQFVRRVQHLYNHPDETGLDEIRLIDGTVLDRYSAPVRDKTGHYYGRIWTFRDITERKKSETRFRRLVDSNAQGVMFWNASGRITGANDAFLRIVGCTREDLENGRITKDGISPPEFAELDRRIQEEIALHGVCAPYEKQLIRKDGHRVPILIGAASFEDDPNEGVCFILDLTERKKLEQQFLRAQRMESIGTLAAGVAHDLNNVLAPILMAVEMLKPLAQTEDDESLLTTLEGSAQRGADLVKQVLSFARGIEGQRVPVNPQRVLGDLVKVIQETFPKSIEVHFHCASRLWSVIGDPTQLHQVFLNLFVNARDAMPRGGAITVSLENVVLDETYTAMNIDSKPGAYVVIKVEDTGTGIAPEVRERIFDPFFTTKEIGKGTGLGLSTTLAIVKSHGGFINLYSELGKGSKFKIYLPANTTEEAADKLAIEQTQLPSGHGELILVVDDEEPIRKVAQRTLERYGYRVLLASHGAEAVAIYVENRDQIAVVLTDMAMPVMDGPATIIALKSINPEVRIIGSSGLVSNGGVAKAVGAGVTHFVPKPYTAAALLQTLHEVLK